MASESLAGYQVYQAVRRPNEGAQIERVFRALCFILDRWKALGQRAADEGLQERAEDGGRLNLIEFDKLCNIVCRIWTALFQETGLRLLDDGGQGKPTEEQVNSVVRFRPPFEEHPGLHGPGEARLIDGRPKYLVTMVRDFEGGEFGYFSFKSKPRQDSPREVTVDESGSPNVKDDAGSTLIEPALFVSDDDDYWQGFTRFEVACLRAISSGLSHLSAKQIRALGTHRNREGTLLEIRRRVRACQRKAKEIAERIGAGELPTEACRDLHIGAGEARRKAEGNVALYAAGFARLSTEFDGAVREAFQKMHQKADEVWVLDAGLREVRASVQRILGVAGALFALAQFRDERLIEPQRGVAARLADLWSAGRAVVRDGPDRTLPESIDKALQGDRVSSDVADLFKDVLGRI